jgi:imidazolonepropionase-like amidohydrolase
MNMLARILITITALALISLPAFATDLVLTGGTVYANSKAAPLRNAVIVIYDGKIESIGTQGEVHGRHSAQVIDCTGKFIVAGFWNSHVHFTEDAWNGAANAPSAKLEAHMHEMLTRWGFTSVFDIGSFPDNTLALRKRVEKGEVPGPRIYTTAGAIYPQDGIPVYIPQTIASQLKPYEASSPEDARRLAKQMIASGADGIKVFAGAIMGHGKVVPMPVEVIRAAADVAHAAGKPVFAHPSNHVGTDNALAGGVDVLAHTIPMENGWTTDELQRMKQQHTALTPTLSLFPDEERKFGGTEEDKRVVLQRAVGELKSYFDEGGTILFGTDVGYTQLYDTTSEYEYMARAGMSWRDILASLTTNPATFFKASAKGRVEKGMDADLVVLDGDPAADVKNFAKVTYTIRGGKVIYSAE